MPGTLVRMCSSIRRDRIGPTPARIAHRRSSPRSRTSPIQRRNRGTSNTNWVWTKSAPAATFVPRRRARNPVGGANGFSTAPMCQSGGTVSSRPDSSRCSSRRVRAVQTSCTPSRSKTGLASGWSPKRGWSPVRSRTFGMPRAAAESRSDCRAMRLRSRQVSCMTGSTPASRTSRLPAMLDIRTWALWLSVTLAASTHPRSSAALRVIAPGSAPRGGPISAVTAKRPAARVSRRALTVLTGGPARARGAAAGGRHQRWAAWPCRRRGPASS